jgi:hypothetical protein
MSIRETLRSIIKGRPAQIGEVRRWANGTFRKTSDGWQEVSQNLDRLNRKDALQQRRRERNRENARRLEHRISVLQEWADDPEKAAEAWKGYPEVERFGAPAAVKAELKLAKKLLRHYKLDRSAENKGKKEYLDDMRDILRSEAEDRVRGRYAGIIDRMQGRLDELDERIGGDAKIVKVSDDQLTHYRAHGVPEGILLHGSEKPLGSLSTGFSDTGDVYLTNSVSVAQNYGDHIYATRIKGQLARFDDPDDRVLNAILKESGRLAWVPERIRDTFDDGNKTEALDFVRHALSQTDYHESPMDDVELQNILSEYGYVGAADGRGRTTVVWDDESLAAPGLSADETVERESLSDRIESAEARMESAVERELARVEATIDGLDQESLERQVDRVFARENSGPLGKLLVKHPNETRYDDVSKRLKTIESERREANRRRQSIGKRLHIQRSGIGQTVFTVVKARPVKYFKRIPTGNPKRPWRYFYNEDEWKTYEKKQKIIQAAVQEARESPHGPETIGDLTVDVHGKAIVVRGETKKHVDLLRKIRETLGIGGWNDALKAWVFPGSRRADVIRLLKEGTAGRSDEQPATVKPWFTIEEKHPARNRGPITQADGKRTKRFFIEQGWNAAREGWSIEDDPYLRTSTASDMWRKGFRSERPAARELRQETIRGEVEAARNTAEDERIEAQARVSIRKQNEINRTVVELLRTKRPEEMTDEDKALLAQYEGQGGQATNETNDYTGKGLLYEYYTPNSVIKKTWQILDGYFDEGAQILEPAAGTGRWFNGRYKFDMREIDRTSATIASILHPEANVSVGPFEEMFLDERRRSKKEYDGKLYDGAVGNPPYGAMTGEFKATEGKGWKRYENYFLSRSLDTVKEGGIVAMIVPSSFLRSGLTVDKKKIFEKAEVVDAYRLPNGSFSHTDIGTDLIILRKNTTEHKDTSLGINDVFFQKHPEKVFGEEIDRRSRFGIERYVKGKLDAFLSAPVGSPKPLSEEHRRAISEGLIGNQNAVGARRTRKNKEAVQAARTKGAIETAIKNAKTGKAPAVLFTQQTFGEKYGMATSEPDLALLRNTSATGKIDTSVPFDPERMAIHNGDHVPLYLYTSGNIIDKLAELETERDNLLPEQYERQKRLLESARKPTIPLSDIALTPLDPFAKGFLLDNGAELMAVFKKWVHQLDHTVMNRVGLMRSDITDYVDGIPVRGRDRDDNARRRRERKTIGNQLFKQFLLDSLSKADQDRLVEQWNYTFNAHVDVEFGKVPVLADGLNTKFKGKEYVIRKPQLDFIGKFMAKGIGCAVHEVGLGKTMTASIGTVNNMLVGRCKRPLIVVPSSILTKWSRDFSSLYPEIKTNVIGTPELNAMSAADGKLKIDDGSVTIMSYDAFTALSFSEERFTELTKDLADQIINPYEKAEKSKRERAKEEEKKDELKGRVAKGTTRVLFDEAGFDHLTVDEAHNFNNIFTDIDRRPQFRPSDSPEANEFTGILGAGQSSDRGMKLWVAARHILKSNQNRNVMLLTATPFTNNPLQVYSLLSLMAKERLDSLGIYNVQDFLATFIETQVENVMEANGQVKQKQTMRRWKNGHVLTALISEFFDRKSGAETGIARPELVERTVVLPMTGEQEEIRDRLEELYDNRDVDGAALKSMGLQQLMNISPALIKDSNYNGVGGEGFVERSPKMKFVVESVAQLYKGLAESGVKKNPGQIIFLPRGVEFFDDLKKALVTRGIPADAIQYMRPEEKGKKAIDPEKRKQGISRFVEIADDFNNPDGRTKIIIGTDTIQEGISLQKNTAVAYNCMMDWNPTNAEQKKGRLWRFGNRQKRVHVFYPLIENSIDTKLAQKHAEKVARINDLFKATGSPFIDTAEINPDEIKLDIIRDPKRKARLKIEQEKAALRVKEQELISLAGLKKVKTERYDEAKERIRIEQANIESTTKRLKNAKLRQKEAANKDAYNYDIEHYQEELKRSRRQVASSEAVVRDIEEQYAKMGTSPEEERRRAYQLLQEAEEIKKQAAAIEAQRAEYEKKFAAELAVRTERTRPLDEIIRDHVAELLSSVKNSQPEEKVG